MSDEASVLHRAATAACAIDARLGDCIAGMASLAPGSIDVVVTSPPYNVGTRYGAYDDTAPRADYLAFMARWADAVARVLAPSGSLFLNVGGTPSDPWVPMQVAASVAGGGDSAAGEPRFHLQNVIHWIKSIAIEREHVGASSGHSLSGDVVVGHYKPINSSRYLNDCHEYVFHFTKTGRVPLDRLALGVPYQDKSNVGRWKGAGRDLRCRGNTWFIPYETIQRRDRDRPHPATFPPLLAEMCIRLHGLARVRLVLDPFLGLGSTGVACARLEVPMVGFEIDETYLSLARERVAAERAQLAESRAWLFPGPISHIL